MQKRNSKKSGFFENSHSFKKNRDPLRRKKNVPASTCRKGEIGKKKGRNDDLSPKGESAQRGEVPWIEELSEKKKEKASKVKKNFLLRPGKKKKAEHGLFKVKGEGKGPRQKRGSM